MNNTISTVERVSDFSTPFQNRDTDFVEQFRVAMLNHGLDVASAVIVPDGKEHRYDADGDRKGTKNGWGALHIEGDQAWGGFGDWKRGTSIPWSAKGAKAPSKAQRKAMDDRIAAAKAASEAQREAAYAAAAERAREVFAAASPADTSHPYLARKRVGAYGLRVGVWEFIDDGTGEVRTVPNTLMAPIYRKMDGKGVISSIEGILPDGSKYGFKGGQKADGYHVIGRPKIVDGREVFLLAEGYSTAAALHEATDHCAVMAFTAGNLPSIAKQVRDGKPDADIVIFSDRDAEALDRSVGTQKGVEAALAVGARLVVPEWTGQKGRDANDIWVSGFSHEWVDVDGKPQSIHIPGPEHIEGCIKFATPCRSPAFMELMRECGISERHLMPAQADAAPIANADASAQGAVRTVTDADDADPSSPIVMGEVGDLVGFWTHHRRVELIRVGDLFRDAGILRLQSLNYWQAWCQGKYDRAMVGNALLQNTKSVGELSARNVPESVATPAVVERSLNLAMAHAKPTSIVIANLLASCDEWRDVIWFNEFADRVEARRVPPCGGNVGQWTDRHDMLLCAWLGAQYGIAVSGSVVVAAVNILALADKRHPVRDYLTGLAWDGVPRLDTWLTAFAGCHDDTYTRNVGAKTLIGAVARIMKPGVKFDTTLVLEGDQGLKKSMLIGALSPNRDWHTDSLDGDLGSKDAAIGLQGKWLIEIAEMASMTRTRLDNTKSFLSRPIDNYRSPFDKRNADHPRQCAFFGTINPEADGRYLNDTTGGRRFWPVACVRTNIHGLKAARDRLWAEAVARFNAGEQWWLTDEVEALAKVEQADRQESNVWAEHVDRFMAHLPPDDRNREWGGQRASRVEEVTTGEIFAAITGKQITKKDLSDSKLIAGALKAAGWVQKRGTKGTGRYWVRS